MIVTVDFAELEQAFPGGDAGRGIHTSFPTGGRDGCRHSGFQILWSCRGDVIFHNQA